MAFQRPHFCRSDSFNCNLSFCCGCHTNIRPDFNIIRSNGVFAAMKFFHAINADNITSDSRNLCTHQNQHIAKVLNMRFTCRILNNCFAFCKNGSHNGVFCGCNRSFVQENISSFKLVCSHIEVTVYGDICAKHFQCQKVSIKASSANNVASRRHHLAFTCSSDKRSCKNNGTAHFFCKFSRQGRRSQI